MSRKLETPQLRASLLAGSVRSQPAACRTRLCTRPTCWSGEGWGMTAWQKHLLSSGFKICQRVISNCSVTHLT